MFGENHFWQKKKIKCQGRDVIGCLRIAKWPVWLERIKFGGERSKKEIMSEKYLGGDYTVS